MAAKQIPELVVKVTSAKGLRLPDKVQIKDGKTKDVIVTVKVPSHVCIGPVPCALILETDQARTAQAAEDASCFPSR